MRGRFRLHDEAAVHACSEALQKMLGEGEIEAGIARAGLKKLKRLSVVVRVLSKATSILVR